MKRNTYWVEFEWNYEVDDREAGGWVSDYDYDACRFNCLKKDIPKEVEKYVKEEMDHTFRLGEYRNLSIKITDSYITTDDEF